MSWWREGLAEATTPPSAHIEHSLLFSSEICNVKSNVRYISMWLTCTQYKKRCTLFCGMKCVATPAKTTSLAFRRKPNAHAVTKQASCRWSCATHKLKLAWHPNPYVEAIYTPWRKTPPLETLSALHVHVLSCVSMRGMWLLPVRARNIPKLPDRRGRKWDPPTSGKKPMKVSGIAKSVFSVATLKGPCTDMPTPYNEGTHKQLHREMTLTPPMVIPSWMAM